MTSRLLTFFRLLRDQGLPISVAESLDALRSASCVGLHDRELLRLTLRTALVKSQPNYAMFDTLFERFFTMPRSRKRQRSRGQQQSDGIGQHPTPRPGSQSLSPRQAPPQQQPAPGQQAPPPPPSLAQHNQAATLQALNDLEQRWKRQLASDSVRHQAEPEGRSNHLPHTPLTQDFPPDRLANMYRQVERLAARLQSRRALRYRRARRGRLDQRRTVLQGLRNGNEVPFTLRYRRRRRTKLRLVVLCDVSGSVWQVSTFFLKLVHTLQSEFASVRSLLFVNSLVEVTDLFCRMRFPQDLDALRHYANLNLFGFSDFGRVFYQFYRDFAADLSRETVIIILGDARNNAFDAQFWTLDEVRQRSRRLIWLNPEPRQQWNTGDSIIGVYAPYCDHILECRTLAHLEQAAEALLQT